MKIAFYSGEMGKKHVSRIMEILNSRFPQHQYNHYAYAQPHDLCHCAVPYRNIEAITKASRSIVALRDVRFITEPHIFSLRERLFEFPLYRFHCKHAAKIIAYNSAAKERVKWALKLDDRRVEVCMPLLAAQHSFAGFNPSKSEMLEVRQRFDLPETYILIVGEADTMHDHGVILRSIFSLPISLSVVVYTRRTTHADVLLKMVRDSGAAHRVQFIYEIDERDLCSLYRMTLTMIYMPSVESSIIPIVEALHQGVPMILSDTPTNREAVGAAAIFVLSHDEQGLAKAIKEMVYNESYRGQLIAQCWAEAKRYSEENLADQLAKIYESV